MGRRPLNSDPRLLAIPQAIIATLFVCGLVLCHRIGRLTAEYAQPVFIQTVEELSRSEAVIIRNRASLSGPENSPASP